MQCFAMMSRSRTEFCIITDISIDSDPLSDGAYDNDQDVARHAASIIRCRLR